MDACYHNQACRLIRTYHSAKLSQEERIVILVKSIEDGYIHGGISLSDMVCSKEGQAGGVSLFEGLLTLPNGHLTVKEVLNTLMEKMDSGEIKIRLGSGRLFRIGRDFRETKILEDLLKIRTQSQGKGSVAEDAVNGVLTHPVMEALIRQKWHSARFIFVGHVRY